jgi:hypothetical protein
VAQVVARGGGAPALERLGPTASRRWRDSGGPPDQALDDATARGASGDHDPNAHSSADSDDHGPNRDTSGQRGPNGRARGKN